MTDRKKIIITIGVCLSVVAAAIVVCVLIARRIDEDDTTTVTSTTDTHQNALPSDNTLARGSRGDEVKKLQKYLNSKLLSNYYIRTDYPVTATGERITTLRVDGIFGEQTELVCKWWFGKPTVKTSELC